GFLATGPAAQLNGTYGSLTVDSHGQWTYQTINGAPLLQALKQGEHAVENFTLRATDPHGASVTQPVEVTVIGTDDAPLFITTPPLSSPNFLLVNEDMAGPVGGFFAARDVDHGACI